VGCHVTGVDCRCVSERAEFGGKGNKINESEGSSEPRPLECVCGRGEKERNFTKIRLRLIKLLFDINFFYLSPLLRLLLLPPSKNQAGIGWELYEP
jgi:hypothetical protein